MKRRIRLRRPPSPPAWPRARSRSRRAIPTSRSGSSSPTRPDKGTDVATRYIAERLNKALGQHFYVDNKPGAGGNIGTEAAARATPDGYTLTMGTNATHGTNQFLYDTLPFDAEKDFEPVILIGSFPMVIAANPAFPGNTVADLIATAKATPKGIDIAMPSTTARIVFELLKAQSQAPLFGIPYKGSATAMTETIGGQVPLIIDTVTAVRPHVAAGKLKAIAVTSLKRTELLPGVKPVAEQGLPGFEVIAWNALYAPNGTPKDIDREAQRRDQQDPRAAGIAPEAEGSRLRRRRRHARAARRVRPRRNAQVGTAHQGGRDQGRVSERNDAPRAMQRACASLFARTSSVRTPLPRRGVAVDPAGNAAHTPRPRPRASAPLRARLTPFLLLR